MAALDSKPPLDTMPLLDSKPPLDTMPLLDTKPPLDTMPLLDTKRPLDTMPRLHTMPLSVLERLRLWLAHRLEVAAAQLLRLFEDFKEGVGAGRQESTGISKIQQPPQSLIGRPLPAYIANFARDAGRQESIGISKRPLPAYITNFDAHRIPAWDPTGIRLHVLPGSRTAVRGTALNPRFGRRSGRKSPFLPLRPPQHETSPRAASSGAAKAALVGLIHAVQEDDPREVALLTVRAIATAVSTSRSYGAFVAATTTLEKGAFALQAAELDHTRLCSPERVPCLQEAIEIGTNDGLAADAGTIATGQWPFNIHDAYPFGSPWTWTSAGSSTAGPPTPPTPET